MTIINTTLTYLEIEDIDEFGVKLSPIVNTIDYGLCENHPLYLNISYKLQLLGYNHRLYSFLFILQAFYFTL